MLHPALTFSTMCLKCALTPSCASSLSHCKQPTDELLATGLQGPHEEVTSSLSVSEEWEESSLGLNRHNRVGQRVMQGPSCGIVEARREPAGRRVTGVVGVALLRLGGGPGAPPAGPTLGSCGITDRE